MKNIRTCIACRNKFDKANTKLIKITKSGENFSINENYFGRSCYVCNKNECIDKTIKNKLINRAFKQKVNDEIYKKIEDLRGN